VLNKASLTIIAQSNENVKTIYHKISATLPPWIAFNVASIDVFNYYSMLDSLLTGNMNSFLKSSCSLNLYSQGKIKDDALLLLLPGGLIGLIISEALVDVISGIRRSKLREGINKLFQSRLSYQVVWEANKIFNEEIASLNDAFKLLLMINYTEEQVKQLVIDKANQINHKIQQTATSASAIENLRKLDRSRGSWTNEDPNPVYANTLMVYSISPKAEFNYQIETLSQLGYSRDYLDSKLAEMLTNVPL